MNIKIFSIIIKIKAAYRKIQYYYMNIKAHLKLLNKKRYDDIFIINDIKKNLISNYNLSKLKNILYCGAVEDQDYSGMIQDLSLFGNVVVFRDEFCYGFELPKTKLLDFNVIKRNSDRLINFIKLYNDNGLKFDLLIGQFWAHVINSETLKMIQNMKIPIFVISMDDLWMKNWEKINGYKLGVIGIADSVDLILTTSKEAVNWYHSNGYNAIFFPLASSKRFFYSDNKKDFDIVFVGNNYGLRGYFIKRLIEKGLKIECFGKGWTNGQISSREMAYIFARAKIVLGFGYVGYNKSILTLKNRDFDAILSGALYITSYNPLLAEMFEEDNEIVFYRSLNECYKKIKFYLSNDKLRKKIAENGRNKVINFHTYEIRFRNLFEKLGLLQY